MESTILTIGIFKEEAVATLPGTRAQGALVKYAFKALQIHPQNMYMQFKKTTSVGSRGTHLLVRMLP